MEYDGLTVGDNIRNLRKGEGMTIEELGLSVDKSASHINQIELGSRKMSIDVLYQLMTVLHTDANTILGVQSKIDDDTYSVDQQLKMLSNDKREYLLDTFQYMIQKCVMMQD